MFPGPPKLNRAPNWRKKGAKLTGMDMGEFTMYNAYLSTALICLIATRVSRVNLLLNQFQELRITWRDKQVAALSGEQLRIIQQKSNRAI